MEELRLLVQLRGTPSFHANMGAAAMQKYRGWAALHLVGSGKRLTFTGSFVPARAGPGRGGVRLAACPTTAPLYCEATMGSAAPWGSGQRLPEALLRPNTST